MWTDDIDGRQVQPRLRPAGVVDKQQNCGAQLLAFHSITPSRSRMLHKHRQQVQPLSTLGESTLAIVSMHQQACTGQKKMELTSISFCRRIRSDIKLRSEPW